MGRVFYCPAFLLVGLFDSLYFLVERMLNSYSSYPSATVFSGYPEGRDKCVQRHQQAFAFGRTDWPQDVWSLYLSFLAGYGVAGPYRSLLVGLCGQYCSGYFDLFVVAGHLKKRKLLQLR